MGMIGDFIKGLVTAAVDDAKRSVRYEARRGVRRALSSKAQGFKERIVKKIKPKVDKFVEKHPSKAKVAAETEMLDAAIKVTKEMAGKPFVAPEKVVVEPQIQDEGQREIEFD